MITNHNDPELRKGFEFFVIIYFAILAVLKVEMCQRVICSRTVSVRSILILNRLVLFNKALECGGRDLL